MSVPLEIIVKSDIGTVVSDQQKIQQSLGQTAIAAQKASAAYEGYGVRSQKITDYTKLASGSLSQLGAAASKTSTEVSNVSSSLTSLGQSLITGGILAAIPLIVIGLQELGDKLFGLTAEQKAYNETLQNTVSDFAKANTQVAEMAQKVELAKQGFDSKDKVLKEFNNTIGRTIGFAKDLDEAESLLVSKGPAYIQMMTLKAAANYALAKSGEILAQSIITANNAGDNSASNALKLLSDKLAKQSQIYGKLAEDLNKAALLVAQKAGINVVDVEKPVKDAKEKIVRHVRDINDVLNDLKKNLAYLEFREINLKTDEAKGKIAALESALAEIVKKFGKGAKNPIVIDIITRINVIKFEQAQGRIGHDESIEKQVQKELEHGVNVKIPVRVHLEVAADEIDKQAEIIGNTVANALASIGDSLADTINGKGNFFGNLFGGLLSALGGGLRQLGIQTIAASKLIAAAKAALKAGSISGVGAGIALVALGALIQAAANNIKGVGFATGVRNFQPSGGVVTVGERGPENIFLPRGSTVQPNNELNAYSGGGGGELVARLELGYDSLAIMVQRGNAKLGINN